LPPQGGAVYEVGGSIEHRRSPNGERMTAISGRVSALPSCDDP
jgi:hypothetical protein